MDWTGRTGVGKVKGEGVGRFAGCDALVVGNRHIFAFLLNSGPLNSECTHTRAHGREMGRVMSYCVAKKETVLIPACGYRYARL